uniref:Thymic stromal lymphopoietin n=2 Tax=Sus scrofa TaxID=9823 RepID=A0A4X1TX27_PIG
YLIICSVFFRKIFILQLIGLVLTYNFTDCDFERIQDIFEEVIHHELKTYINGTKSIEFNKFVYCDDRVSKWLVLLAFSRETPGVPGREYLAVRGTPGGGRDPWRRRPSRDHWAAGNFRAGAQLRTPVLFQFKVRSLSDLRRIPGEAPPRPPRSGGTSNWELGPGNYVRGAPPRV